MVNLKTTKADWLDAGLRALADGGVDAVRAEGLARRLGVTKGGFYGYFDNRSDFLGQLLGRWEQDVTAGIVAQVQAGASTDPRVRVRHLAEIVSTHDRPTRRIETELAIRSWARRDAAAAAAVRRVDAAQGAFLRSLFDEFCAPEEARARTVMAMSMRLAAQFIDFDGADATDRSALDLVLERLVR